jgi:hypothetical protein
VRSYYDTVILQNVVAVGNTAGESGGAVSLEDVGSQSEITSCRIIGNTAQFGAGLAVAGSVTISECVIADNEAIQFGGGIFSVSPCTITSCTLVRNLGQILGGGILHGGEDDLVLENTIVAHSMGGGGIGCFPGVFISASCCDSYGNAGDDWYGAIDDQTGVNGNISADPRFCDPETDDFHLQWGSPCLPVYTGGCGLIGALGAGNCPSASVETLTWGGIKARFRDGGR